MKKSTKAMLLSAFVFPGAGHLYLRRFPSAIFLAGCAASALYFIVANAVSRGLDVVEKIQNMGGPPDVDAIISILLHQPAGAENPPLRIATTVAVACWIIGIVDSYRIGRRGEKVGRLLLDKKS